MHAGKLVQARSYIITSHIIVIEHRKLEVLEKTAEEIFGSTGNRVRWNLSLIAKGLCIQ